MRDIRIKRMEREYKEGSAGFDQDDLEEALGR
jgi:hypothetical protein